jgi:predicted nucleotidyltransferase component of viral defense system
MMQTVLEQMLGNYKTNTLEEQKNALKEVVQEVALCGLSRAGFFKSAAFYGGTALRIFYGLDRFSEDLDFSLVVPNADFRLNRYFASLESELSSLGLKFSIEEKQKNVDSAIKSAFLKGNTREHILNIYEVQRTNINPDEVIKIKFEIDTNPPAFAQFENKYRLLPTPYQVKLYDLPSLFAGKLHAVICRSWKSRVKGRDLYDYIFYLAKQAKVNLPHLRARLEDSEVLSKDEPFSMEKLVEMLNRRFDTIDFEQAKQDVLPFITNPDKLDLWSKDFFIDITKNLQADEKNNF